MLSRETRLRAAQDNGKKSKVFNVVKLATADKGSTKIFGPQGNKLLYYKIVVDK
jgi:hypothetical protein